MSQWGGRNQVSQAWWVPLDGVAQIPTEETADDPIVRRLEALAIPSTPETQCFKCCGRGHWSSECPVPVSGANEATARATAAMDGRPSVRTRKIVLLFTAASADAQIRQQRADALSKQRKWEQHLDAVHFKNRVGRYSWGPQGEMGPQWGSSYTGD